VANRGSTARSRIHSLPPTNTLQEAGGELCVPIRTSSDILEARQKGREIAGEMGFSSMECTLIATAISELARNIVLYAGRGEIRLSATIQTKLTDLPATGIVIVAHDEGPGIQDLRSALQDGFSTSRGLGLGLPGVKRIMDEFDIVSKVHGGTTVTVKKWKQ
jgi:serine/threonine-protein kinase RsbT